MTQVKIQNASSSLCKHRQIKAINWRKLTDGTSVVNLTDCLLVKYYMMILKVQRQRGLTFSLYVSLRDNSLQSSPKFLYQHTNKSCRSHLHDISSLVTDTSPAFWLIIRLTSNPHTELAHILLSSLNAVALPGIYLSYSFSSSSAH